MTVGYIAMCARKSKDAPEYFAPLSYGRGDEPAHDKILKRGRATIFKTEHEAWEALRKSLINAESEGHKWPKLYQYAIVEVEAAP